MRKFFGFLIILLLISTRHKAASRYWVGGTGSWTDAANHWASGSGGSPASGNLPTSSDDIYFDSNSGTGTATISSTITVNTITFSTSCSAIILDITSGTTTISSTSSGVVMNTGSHTLRVSGGTLTVTNMLWASGGTLQLNSGTLNIYCSAATGTYGLSIAGGTVNCAGATVNIGDGSNEVLALNSGTLSVSAGTVNVRTEFYTLGGTFNLSGGTINVHISTTTERYYCFDMFSTTYNFTGGTIDIKNAASPGSLNVWIASSNTAGSLTGGVLKFSITNGDYSIESDTRLYSLEINSSGKTASIGYSNLSLAGNFTLTAGTFDVSTYAFSVAGNWTNNGSAFNYNTGTVTFNGTSAQQILGSTASTFYNLTLNNSSGLTLAPSAGIATTVRNTLTLTSGKITLGNYDLKIGASGVSGNISGGSSSNYIITNGTGVLNQYNIGTGKRTSVVYPVGISSSSYTPLTLSVVGSTTVDNFSLIVSQSVLASGTSGSAYTSKVIDRTWNVTEGTTGGSNVTLTLQWNGSDELTSFTRSNCYVSHYASGAWASTSAGASASGSNPYTIVSGTCSSFSPFAIASNQVLPVELLSFTAIPSGKIVMLNWSTASETNNKGFTIQRSVDGMNFEDVTFIPGQINSAEIHKYQTTDDHPLPGLSYYRIRQTDLDSKYTLSEVVPVLFEDQPTYTIYPNPTHDDVLLLFNDSTTEHIKVYINDVNGRLRDVQEFPSHAKGNALRIKLSHLEKGCYFISLDHFLFHPALPVIRQ